MLYPEGTKVVIKPDTVDEITKGGLIVPESVRDGMQVAVTRGFIHAIGPDADVKFLDADGVKENGKVGDRVMFSKFAGASLRIEGVEYRILQDQDIACKIEVSDEKLPDTRKSMVK